MAVVVVTFPGSNCDRDCVAAVSAVGGRAISVFHKETELPPDTDAIILPAIHRFADAGGAVVGIYNGFQILCEAQILPGALLRNTDGRFHCADVELEVVGDSPLLSGYERGDDDSIVVPIAHGEGNYFADDATLDLLERERRVAFRYVDVDAEGNGGLNGARRGIAGIIGGAKRNVLGMMPHPERRTSLLVGGEDGLPLIAAVTMARRIA